MMFSSSETHCIIRVQPLASIQQMSDSLQQNATWLVLEKLFQGKLKFYFCTQCRGL